MCVEWEKGKKVTSPNSSVIPKENYWENKLFPMQFLPEFKDLFIDLGDNFINF